MYDCNDCMQFFVVCPCCELEFCPSCGKTESDNDKEDNDE
jgi:hypothetical protein